MTQKLHIENEVDNSKITKSAVAGGLESLSTFVDCILGEERGGNEFLVVSGRPGICGDAALATSVQTLGVIGCTKMKLNGNKAGWGTSAVHNDKASCRPLITLIKNFGNESEGSHLNERLIRPLNPRTIMDESEDFLYDLLAIKVSESGITEAELMEWSRFVKLASEADKTIQDLSRSAIKRILRSWSSVYGLIVSDKANSCERELVT